MRLAPLLRLLAILLLAISARVHAQGTLIPLTARRDMVFDHSGQRLFISTSDGWVRPYNLGTGQLETGYNLGGSLNGMDIAPDDSFLLVAQDNVVNGQGTIHRVDFATGAITDIKYAVDGTPRAWDIAIGSHGRALFTVGTPMFGQWPVREIDLATNTVRIRTDVPGSGWPANVYGGTQIARSADATRLYFFEEGFPGAFVYNAPSDSFGVRSSARAYEIPATVAVSRDGRLLATRRDSFITVDKATDLSFQHSYNGFQSGVAFDGTADILYVVDPASSQIIAYDSKTFGERFRLNVGESVPPNEQYSAHTGQFNTGTLVASNDGRYLALETASGIRLLPLAAKLPPRRPLFTRPCDMVFDHAGKYLYITTANGFVWPYDLANKRLEWPFDVGGLLNAIDIAPDDSFLLIAHGNSGLAGYGQGIVDKLDLTTGRVAMISYPSETFNYETTWDLAIGSNGLAFFSTTVGGSGASGLLYLRQIDLATNAVSIRTDVPATSNAKLWSNTIIDRSADRTRMLFREPNSSDGPTFSYSALTNTFGSLGRFNAFHEHVNSAVSRDGSTMMFRYKDNISLFNLPDLSFAHEWFGLDSGIAFDAVQDRFYAVKSATDQIVAYDSSTYAERFRIAIGEDVPATPKVGTNWGEPFGDAQFGVGTLVASQDGDYLALFTPTGVRVINVATRSTAHLPLGAEPATVDRRPQNVSTRVAIGANNEMPIAGFIVTGAEPKKIVVRAIGPSLTAAGVAGTITDPALALYGGSGQLIAFNDNWRDSQEAAITQTGLPPTDSHEAAIVQTLAPGAYTAVMGGRNGETGVGLVEVYDVDATSISKLANLSTRGFVGNGSNVMIAGIILGNGGGIGNLTQRILLRGLGPSLAQFQVSGPIQDPYLSVHDGNGNVIRSNADWKDTQQSEIEATGLAPSDARESALIVDLPPGQFTAVLGGNPSPGVGLVEVYALP